MLERHVSRIDASWLATSTAPYIAGHLRRRNILFLGRRILFLVFLLFLFFFLIVAISLDARSGLRLVGIFLLETADGQGGLPTQHLAGR